MTFWWSASINVSPLPYTNHHHRRLAVIVSEKPATGEPAAGDAGPAGPQGTETVPSRRACSLRAH